MEYTSFYSLFLFGVMGAFSAEVLKLYELKNKLNSEIYKVLYRSYVFWIVFFLFLLVSGFLTWAFLESEKDVTVWQTVITGMGISTIGKKILEGYFSKRLFDAGDDNHTVELKDLFR